MTGFADLHIHTTFSDSTSTPVEVIRKAHECGLRCIAITDHDTIAGISPAVEAAQPHGIEVIPGIELSCEANGRDVHVLGYFFDYQSNGFLSRLHLMQDARVIRMAKMIEKLRSFGIKNITLEEVRAIADTQSVGRMHLATVLKQKGWVRNTDQAFDKYLSGDGPAYVAKYYQTPEEGIAFINDAGGVAVLAHPMLTLIDELIPSLVKAGLKGLEVYYPNIPKPVIRFYENLATKYGLLATGGSDAHGKGKDSTRIGAVKVSYEVVEKMKELCKDGRAKK